MSEPALKRRKVRKGTKSCWECRRRKIKCLYQQPDDAVCINCREHDAECLSQHLSAAPATARSEEVALSEAAPNPAAVHPDNQQLTQRLSQLEKLLKDVLRAQGQPASSPEAPGDAALALPSESIVDLLDSSAVTNAQAIAAAISCPGAIFQPSPPESHSTFDSLGTASTASTATIPINTSPPESVINNYYLIAQQDGSRKRREQLSRELFAILPEARLRRILAHETPGALAVLNLFHSREDQVAGRIEPAWSLASANWPTVDTHPVLIAKRLLQYSICMQQLPPKFDVTRLGIPAHQQPCEVLGLWVGAATSLLAGNDELVGCIEGIEALVLLSLFQSDAGHLRKAWVTTRRAITLGQLMGMNRSSPPPIRSCSSSSDPNVVPSIALLWYRITSADYYQSLVLGLPIGSCNRSSPNIASNDPVEALEKMHAIVARRVVDRNEMIPGDESYALTQSIDKDLCQATDKLGDAWWETPDLAGAVQQSHSSGGLQRLFDACSTLNLQVKHFTMILFLHLPFLLSKDEQHERSRSQCMHASRSVLDRFLVYRREYVWHGSGRQVDYSALVSAMALCLGHLGIAPTTDRQTDRELVEKTLIKFRELAAYKRDRLSTESAETIHQLLPILTAEGNGLVKISVPFLGTVTIAPRAPSDFMTPSASAVKDVGDPSLLFSGPDFEQTSNMGIFGWYSANPIMPEVEDWTFQGIDTTFWSTLNPNS